ncbi:bone morphogenetic protein 6-like [Hydractinia symbiolongicarpus]|uniref:bone morphogenetic protein 6-like n=1 Tax=Hydractinia symbiolongicarpus TaxID=13093 RepID=UPI00254E60DE|nr:bone morphogenetic protein 6-like [Hydractinia symbiolongicarpus]
MLFIVHYISIFVGNVVENIAECEKLATAEQSTKCREQGDKRDKDNRLKKIEEIRKTECRKVDLDVALKSLGWNPNLNPKTFPRNYCVGECTYSDSYSSVEYSNHAMIQSILRQKKIHRMPKPCCAPNKFADLTLYSSVGNRTKVHVRKDFTILGCSCQ